MLLADEPTGNLDTAAAREVVAVLRERHADGQTIVLVTHDMRVASAAQRVVAMRDGRIVGETAPEADAGAALSRVVTLDGVTCSPPPSASSAQTCAAARSTPR